MIQHLASIVSFFPRRLARSRVLNELTQPRTVRHLSIHKPNSRFTSAIGLHCGLKSRAHITHSHGDYHRGGINLIGRDTIIKKVHTQGLANPWKCVREGPHLGHINIVSCTVFPLRLIIVFCMVIHWS